MNGVTRVDIDGWICVFM